MISHYDMPLIFDMLAVATPLTFEIDALATPAILWGQPAGGAPEASITATALQVHS